MSEIAAPLTPLRQIIAARMQEAKQTIPHYRVTTDIVMDAVIALRQQLNTQAEADSRISINDCLIKASALALMQWPAINSQFTEQGIVTKSNADIAIVVAVEGGLSTPVLRRAEQKACQPSPAKPKRFPPKPVPRNLKCPRSVMAVLVCPI